jgi:ribonuclease P protein subunit POP4
VSANSPASTSASTPTPATLSRHELNGLDVRVAHASNPDAIGISGRVVSETEHTFVIEGDDGRERQVPKKGATFEFVLPAGDGENGDDSEGSENSENGDGNGNGDERTYVTVEGDLLRANPARRTERKERSKWR